jgi:hypothetical protein
MVVCKVKFYVALKFGKEFGYFRFVNQTQSGFNVIVSTLPLLISGNIKIRTK